MNIITLDFETFFDPDSGYTLKKQTTEEYCRDPRFEVHGVGIRYHNGDKRWYDDPEEFLHLVREDPDVAILCHHAHFDGFILSHHYGIRPKLWLDTLSMARMVQGNHLSASLEALAKRYGLAAKNVPYNLFKGKRWGELTPDVQRLVADGCLHDVELTWQLFNKLMRGETH